MRRKRRGQPIHGWVAVDKDIGFTSTQVVGRVRSIFDAQKAGHAGTLDPLATGVLPIALGEATKTVPYVMDGTKVYRFTAGFGEARDTDDLEGRVIASSDIRPDDAAILAALPAFTGTLSQVPPVYSAIKIAGVRSYKKARDGDGESPPARNVEISRFELVDRLDPDHAVFEVECGKGTYIRSLARDLGVRLGTVAYVSELRRTLCGPFSEKDAISLDKLAESMLSATPQDTLLPVTTALDDIPALAMTDTQTDHLRHGRAVRARRGSTIFVDANKLDALRDGDVLCAMSGEIPVALVRLEGEEIQPVRVLNIEGAHRPSAETE
ncbi:MAG: tRNA pseudouridine(55) synthase TruB [Rhodospirillaceae bacterium]|nr:tRNA pseudouridine(55) synthase TruB [Rhodospirillaceae bacterium]